MNIDKIQVLRAEDGSQLDVLFCDERGGTRVFSILIACEYSPAFRCERAETDRQSDHLKILLLPRPQQIVCPYCGGSRISIHKQGRRTVCDLFELDNEGIDGLDGYECSILPLEVTYQNTSYSCNEVTCHRRFKADVGMFERGSKSEISDRVISFIYQWKTGFLPPQSADCSEDDFFWDGFGSVSVQTIAENLKEYHIFSLSTSEIYKIIQKSKRSPFKDFALMENKNESSWIAPVSSDDP